MTDIQKEQIIELREKGYGYGAIATTVGVKKDSVVAFCRKNGLTGTKADNTRVELKDGVCLNCSAPIVHIPHKRQKKFCSDKCRLQWWLKHNKRKCECCGKECKKKYCSHDCYIKARYGL